MRFLIAGAAQNAASYGAYLLLLWLFAYPIAYLSSFAIGVLIAFLLNSLYVFRVPLRWSKLVPYPLVYLIQAAAGLALTSLLVEYADMSAAVAPAVVLAVTVPITYFGNKIVLGIRPHATTDDR